MKKIISTVLALTMISNIAITAMAEEFVDVETTEAVIEVTDENIWQDEAEESFDDAQLFASGDKVIKSSPEKIDKVKAGIDNAPVGPLAVKTHTFENFKVNMNSTFADYENFSIEEEDGNKFVRMAAGEFAYSTNPVSNVEFTMASAREYIVSYRFRFSKISNDWFEIGIGSSRVNMMFSAKRIAMNYGYSDFKNGTGNTAAYKERYEELYGSEPKSQEWTLHSGLEEGVWYTVTLKINLNSAADGGQCYDFTVVSDDSAVTPVDKTIEKIPFRNVGSASDSIGTLKFVAPHNDGSKTASEYQLDLDDVESYPVPDEDFYFDVTGPEALSDGVNTIVTSYNNLTGSDKNIKEYIAISEDGILKEVVENTFFAAGESKNEFELVFNESDYSGNVTYDVFVTDSDTGATLAVKAGEGGEAPSGDFVTTELGYRKIVANVATTDTYNAGFVTVYNPDGDIVYMADVNFSNDTSVECKLTEDAKEGNYTFDITVSNADGDAKNITVDADYRKDSYIVDQFNAEDADIGALIAIYGEAIGLDLSGEYTTKAVFIDNYIAQAGPFADAEGIKYAFAQAEEAASQLVGDFTETTAKASDTQITRDVVDFENFSEGKYSGKDEVIDKVNVNWTYTDYASSEIVKEDGNKYYRLTQKAGFTVANNKKTAITLTSNTDAYPDTNKAQMSFKLRFDTLNGGWHVINVGGQLASLYVSSKKFGINYGTGHKSGLKQHIFSGVVTEGEWYTVVYDIDFAKTFDKHYDFDDVSKFNKDVYTPDNNYAGAKGTFSIDIYKEDGTLFASTRNTVGEYCPFREKSNALHLYVAPAEGSVDSVISVDDISRLSYDPEKASMAFTATGTKNLMPGKNYIKVDFESLYGDDKDVNVYVPVYADGEMIDFEKEEVSVKAGAQTNADVEITVSDKYSNEGKAVYYDVFVMEKLGGYNYAVTSAVEEAGTIEASLKADFDEKALNVSAATNLDNGVVVILAPGKTLDDAENDPLSSIIYMAETKGGNINLSGAVSDSFGKGDYTVVVTGQNSKGNVVSDSATAYYCGNDAVDQMIADFNGITDANASTVIGKYITEIPVLSSTDEKFASYYAENEELLNSLAVSGKPYEKVSDIIATFYTAYAIDEMKASDTPERFSDVFEANASIYDIDVTSDEYLDNKEEILDYLYANKENIEIATIKAMYEDAVIVAEFNNVTRDNASEIISKYADKLALDLTTEYAQYPQLVINEFVKSAPFADIADIKAKFAQAVKVISQLEGDYTQTIVKQSEAQEYAYPIDFTDAVVGSGGSLGIKGITYEINDTSVGSVEIAEEGNNKYLALKQEDGYVAGADEHAVGAIYKSSQVVDNWTKAIGESKIKFSYRVKLEGIGTAGWTYLQINNLSSLYITSSRKFGLNGSGTQAGSFADIAAKDGEWYKIDYVMNFATKTYDVTLTNESGESQTLTGRTFRGSATDIVFCPWTDQHKGNGAKSYVYVDDINSTVMANSALTYKAIATKDLLPGENVIEFEFNNISDYEETPVVYIPVYVDGVLKNVVTERFNVLPGEVKEKVFVEIDSDDIKNSDVTYDILVMTEIGGFNYTPICMETPAVGAEASVEASVKIDFDKKAFKINTSTMYIDNMTVALIAPGADTSDASVNPGEYVAYMVENDGGEQVLDTKKKPTGERTFETEVAIRDDFGSGWYTLIVTGQDAEFTPMCSEVKVYYSGNEITDDFVSDFNGATDATIETVVNKYLTTYPILSSQDSRLTAYYAANKAQLNLTCLDKKAYSKPSEIINTVFSAFYASELLAAENKEKFVEIFEENASYFDIDVKDENYIENKDDVIDRLYENQEDITATEFKSDYDTAVMLARFNNAGTTNIESVLNDYNEALELDFDKDDFTDKEYLAFRKDLTKKDNEFDSAEDILKAYKKAKSAAKNSSDSSSSGGGSSSGSKPSKVVGGAVATGGAGGQINVALDKPYVESEVQIGNAQENSFADLEGVEWAVESINALKKMGVVNGVDETHFNPNANVTREEFAKMIVAAFNVEASGKTFADAPEGQWYTPYVNALASAGIANGVGNDNFGVGQTITRQDAAVMLDKAAQNAKYDYDWDVSALYIFTDYVADYAKDSIQKLYQIGVINGTSPSTFSSLDTLTRAQAAKMIYYMLQLGNK